MGSRSSMASSCAFFSSLCSTSESWSMGMFKSMRAAVWAKRIADLSFFTAARTTSRSTRMGLGMCCKARPAFPANSVQKALSHWSSSDAYLNASASLMAHAITNCLSILRSSDAPAKAAPQPAVQSSSTKSLSALVCSFAPWKAVPFSATASRRNLRFARKAGSASMRQVPVCRTASRTSVLSALRPTSACANAKPLLAQIAA
mmetsp:Transcript_12336/g.33806  ORF Transcript_12336/g.33806 Transcript_12336/m.33806 type:complete len:203 (+) Transcript_12336:1218-1826(+)